MGESDKDSKIRREAKSLAKNELGDFEFLVAIVIWYDILSQKIKKARGFYYFFKNKKTSDITCFLKNIF